MTTSSTDLAQPTDPRPAVAVERVRSLSVISRIQSKLSSVVEYPATYALVGINVLVFLIMFGHSPAMALLRHHTWSQAGGSISPQEQLSFFWNALNAPFDTDVIDRFGGSDTLQILLHGQWWRLVTSTFVHVTILHLLVNMWCLWNLGFFGEPLLGKPGLVSVYLLTGAAGMMLSLAWSVFVRQPGIVAGASGAVFGIAGILIVLLSNRNLKVPWQELVSLRRSVIWFAALNLAVGILPRLTPAIPARLLSMLHVDPASLPQVDNTAHLGGFLSGLALGLPLFPRMTTGKASYRSRQRLVFACMFVLLCVFGYGVAVFSMTPQ